MPSNSQVNCPWLTDPEASTGLESLQAILNCASRQGCRDCVACSERALPLFLSAARRHAAAPGVNA